MWVVGVASDDTYEEVVIVVLLDGTAAHVDIDENRVNEVTQVRQLADRNEKIP